MTRRKIIILLSFALAAGILLAVYAVYDPAEAGFFPRCSLKALTGWECPGCGAQRAFHAVLHGRIGEAIAYNPFLLMALPYAGAIAATANRRTQRLHDALTSPAACYSYVAAYFIWWAARNMLL